MPYAEVAIAIIRWKWEQTQEYGFFFLMGDAVMIGMCKVLLGINDLHIR